MRLDQSKIGQIDQLFQEFTAVETPGCAIGILLDGEVVYKQGYGCANLEFGLPITTELVFCLASNAKQFTGMSVALLEADGVVSSEDDLRKFVPEFPGELGPVTIGDLLHHTSGIRDYYGDYLERPDFQDNDFITEDEAIEFIIGQEALEFTPGEQYVYSNSNYVLLSLAVNRVSGQSLGQFAQERIFQPLGMKNTFFREIHSKVIKNRVVGYCVEPVRNSQSKYFNISGESSDPHHINMSNMEITGDDGVWSIMDDLLIWERNLYVNRLGGPEVLERFLAPAQLTNGERVGYGYGIIELIH